MDNFLFIIPEGWRQVTGDALDLLGVNAVLSLLAGGNYTDLTDLMRAQQLIGEDDHVVEARIFEGVVLAYRI